MKILAIDPDCVKSGWAAVDTDEGRVTGYGCAPFWDLLAVITCNGRGGGLLVIEDIAGSTRRYHQARCVGVADRISNNVGRVQQVAVLLHEYAVWRGFAVEWIQPAPLVWRRGKPSTDELNSVYGSYLPAGGLGRCNQDERDAIQLAIRAGRERGLIPVGRRQSAPILNK